VNGIGTASALLVALQGEKSTARDSLFSKEKDVFEFSFNEKKYHHGFYRLAFGGGKNVDFLFDGKDLQMHTSAASIFDSMKVTLSESNKRYYAFIKLQKSFKTKIELLQPLLQRYPEKDEFYTSVQQKIISLRNEYFNFIDSTFKTDSTSFIARYVRSAGFILAPPEDNPQQQLVYLKAHLLDHVDFNDPELIFSDLFTNKAIEYLSLYRNPQLPKELLEKEFIKAIDTLTNRAKVNVIVYEHVVEYLLDGFKQFGFDAVWEYIVDTYVSKDNLCLNEKAGSVIQRRIDQNKKLSIGSAAPNFLIEDAAGKTTDLYKITAERILLVFYASWCPHCKTMLPSINALLKKDKKLIVVAVSLDTDQKVWKNFAEQNLPECVNVCDLKGWDGDAAGKYFVYATPTMFLLDGAKKIAAKPRSLEELAGR